MPQLRDLRFALLPFISSRILLLVILVFAHGVHFDRTPAREEHNFHAQLNFSFTESVQAMRCAFSSADGTWYFELAEKGYDREAYTAAQPKNWVFFPLYPFSIKLLNYLTGSPLRSGLLISNICFLLALCMIRPLAAKLELGDEDAQRICWLLCFFPTSYFFSAPLTESPFLLLSIFCWYAALCSRPLSAAAAFFALALVRPTGIVIYPAFLLLLKERDLLFTRSGAAAALIAPLGFVGFLIFLQQLTGNPLAFAGNQIAWGRSGIELDSTLHIFSTGWRTVMQPWNFVWMNFAALIFGWCGAIWLLRRRSASLALVLIAPLVVFTTTGTVWSGARFIGELFPIYLYLNQLAQSRNAERCIFAVLVSLYAILIAFYGHHVTLGMS